MEILKACFNNLSSFTLYLFLSAQESQEYIFSLEVSELQTYNM